MSGFEIAGIILGAYPIILGALEAYRETRGGKGATSFARHLNTERIIFKEFVFNLVALHASEIGHVWSSRDDVAKCTLWSDAALQEKLKSCLGTDKAENVVALLEEIRDLLTLIQNELAPIDDGIELLRKFRGRLRHVRINMPQSTLKEQLAKLTALNTQLQRLLTERPIASISQTSNERNPNRRLLWRGSSHAIDIYNALHDSYRCDCSMPHRANFGLPRMPGGAEMLNNPGEMSQFELLFATDQSRDEDSDALSLSVTQGLSRSWSQASIYSGSFSSSRRFSISECVQSKSKVQTESISDLCIFTNSCESKEPQLTTQRGVLSLNDRRFELQKATELPETPLTEQLDHLLTDQSFLRSRQERISLALSLSHAVLSLCSTPWIQSCWTWEDLSIDRENAGRIFAAQSFYSCHNAAAFTEKSCALVSAFWEIRGEPELTRLGFALVELALGQRLADLRSEYDLESSDIDTLDYLTAMKIVDSGRIMQAEGKMYENVVKSCLRHQFISDSEVIGLNSSQPGFHTSAERCIVEPLHKIVTASWGIA